MSKSNPSHSRTSSVASVLMVTRWFLRTQLWVWPLVAALVLVFIGVWLRVKMEGATKQQIADMLQTILNANNEALHLWSVTMKTDAENLAEDEVLMGNPFSVVCDFQAANPHERKESYFFDSSG